MKSRFKIGTLLTIGITLLLGLALAAPASADRVTPPTDSSQSIKAPAASDNSQANSSCSAGTADSSSTSNDTKTSKASQSSASRTNTSQDAASTNSTTAAASDSASATNSTAASDNKQATATVAVSVVDNSQQPVDQAATSQTSDVSKAKSVKKVTLTTPNTAKQINHQSLDQKIALIPQVSKKALIITGGIALLVWVPTIVVIFNTFI